MALTIVATVGSASANSFVTEAEQITYMATRGNASTWTTLSGATCTEAEKVGMIEATRELSALAWQGVRVDTTQALSWPRQYVTDPDDPTGDYFASTVVPMSVKDATAELAFQFLKAGTTDLADADALANVTQKVIGPLSTSYSSPAMRAVGIARYPSVTRFLRGLLLATGGTISRLVRG